MAFTSKVTKTITGDSTGPTVVELKEFLKKVPDEALILFGGAGQRDGWFVSASWAGE